MTYGYLPSQLDTEDAGPILSMLPAWGGSPPVWVSAERIRNVIFQYLGVEEKKPLAALKPKSKKQIRNTMQKMTKLLRNE
jgi:hypothetical protein